MQPIDLVDCAPLSPRRRPHFLRNVEKPIFTGLSAFDGVAFAQFRPATDSEHGAPAWGKSVEFGHASFTPDHLGDSNKMVFPSPLGGAR